MARSAHRRADAAQKPGFVEIAQLVMAIGANAASYIIVNASHRPFILKVRDAFGLTSVGIGLILILLPAFFD